jgi:hypothetical protein
MTPVGRQMVVVAVASTLFGVAIGFAAWFPRTKPVVETATPAVRQADSSLVLARAPNARAKAPAIVPKGQTLDRVVEATVQPAEPVIVHDTILVPAGPARAVVKVDTVLAPPVRLNITYTDLPDGSHHVIASSPDGTVTAGVDIPVKNAIAPRLAKWSAGFVRNFQAAAYSAFVTRDLGPVLVYGDVAPKQGPAPAHVSAGISLRF